MEKRQETRERANIELCRGVETGEESNKAEKEVKSLEAVEEERRQDRIIRFPQI